MREALHHDIRSGDARREKANLRRRLLFIFGF
jgi:hypothetical protein